MSPRFCQFPNECMVLVLRDLLTRKCRSELRIVCIGENMVRKKFFSSGQGGSDSIKHPDLEKVYKSAAKSSILSGFRSIRRHCGHAGASPSESKPQKAQKTLKLGGNNAGSSRLSKSRSVRLQCIFRAPSHIVGKMKERYSSFKEQARQSNVKISDLFVGNQLLMHVNAAPVRGRRKSLTPSEGFLSQVRPPVQESELRER
ncbi:hypothetical protein R1sor_016784 [Riccia sorocarpa]|uniref:Ribosomal protein S10 n=1 Tax=Riccia sorocarpa TaxID=122646 RepID=A0ABD3HJK4_9MARC